MAAFLLCLSPSCKTAGLTGLRIVSKLFWGDTLCPPIIIAKCRRLVLELNNTEESRRAESAGEELSLSTPLGSFIALIIE